MLKPYPFFRTQCPYHLPLPLPLPFNPIPKLNPSPLLLSPTHHHQPTLCASNNNNPIWWRAFSKSQPSNRKILQLASILALNIKILPEPFNFLAGEIARGAWAPHLPGLSILRAKNSNKKTSNKRRTKLAFFAFALICLAGFWSWKISELEIFVRVLFFGLVGVSLIRMSLGKKAVKEWILGFLVGFFLMVSWGLGKEDLNFWVQRLRVCSPASKIVIRRNRNRFWRMSK